MNGARSALPYRVRNDGIRAHADVSRLRAMTEATLLPEAERRRLIASIIKRGLERASMSSADLADRIGRSRGTVSEWARGVSTPSLVDLGPICLNLGLDPRAFVELPPMPHDPLEDFLLPPAVVQEIADEQVPAAEIAARRSSRKPTPLRKPARRRRAADPQGASRWADTASRAHRSGRHDP